MSRHPISTNSSFLARAIVPTGVCSLELRGYGVARQSTANSEGLILRTNFGTIKIKAEIQKRAVDLCVLMQEMEAQRTRSNDEKRNRVFRHHELVSLTSFYDNRQTN